MLKVIYKYPIKEEKILLPLGAEILSAKLVRGVICIYALVDPNEMMTVEHKVYILGTGHLIQEEKLEGMEFVDTVIEADEVFGELVWHVWCGR